MGKHKHSPVRKEYYEKNKEDISKRRKELYSKNKEEKHKKQKEYREKNRDRIKEQRKRYYRKHKEKINRYSKEYSKTEKNKAYQKEYSESNKEKRKQYKVNNKEKIAKQAKEYREKNKDRIKEREKEYRKNNPEKTLAKLHKRKSYKKNADGHFAAQDIKHLELTQNNKCYYCFAEFHHFIAYNCKKGYHIEHKIPLARGGTNWIKNICLSCPNCNLKKNILTEKEYKSHISQI